MQNTHPLMLVAAGAVTIASLAAAAHFTGLLPGKSDLPPPQQVASLSPAATPTPPTLTAKPESVVTVPAGATVTIAPPGNQAPPTQKKRPVTQEPARQAQHTPPARPAPQPAYTPPPVVCHECGTIDSVREITTQGQGTGVGAVGGGVLGGVLGNQVGRGKGKDAATIIGAIGGAVAGHQIEKTVRTEKQYQVNVRFDDGNHRSYTLTNAQWRPGDRVRLAGDGLAPL